MTNYVKKNPAMEWGITSSWSGARLRFQQHPPIKGTQRYLIAQSQPGHEKRADSSRAIFQAKRFLGNRWSRYHIPWVAICVKTHNTAHAPVVVVCLWGLRFLWVLHLEDCVCPASTCGQVGSARTWSLATTGHRTLAELHTDLSHTMQAIYTAE